MADFCKQCSLDEFGEDYGQLAYLVPPLFNKHVICEGCGPTLVTEDGTCIGTCLEKHGPEAVLALEDFITPIRLKPQEPKS